MTARIAIAARANRLSLLLLIGAIFVSGCSEDLTVDAPEVCEVHHVKMQKTTVPIAYAVATAAEKPRLLFGQTGYVGIDATMDQATSNLFPHAQEWIAGGFDERLTSPRKAVIYVCPQCRSARLQWAADNDRTHTNNAPPAAIANEAQR